MFQFKGKYMLKHMMSNLYARIQNSLKKQTLGNGLLTTYIMKFKILIIYLKTSFTLQSYLGKGCLSTVVIFSKCERHEFFATFCVMMTPPGWAVH